MIFRGKLDTWMAISMIQMSLWMKTSKRLLNHIDVALCQYRSLRTHSGKSTIHSPLKIQEMSKIVVQITKRCSRGNMVLVGTWPMEAMWAWTLRYWPSHTCLRRRRKRRRGRERRRFGRRRDHFCWIFLWFWKRKSFTAGYRNLSLKNRRKDRFSAQNLDRLLDRLS